MTEYYQQKEDEIKQLIYDLLCITEDKHLTKELIYNNILDNLDIITDIRDHSNE